VKKIQTSSWQFAYKSHGTKLPIFSVKQTRLYYNFKVSTIYTAFLDPSEAFSYCSARKIVHKISI